MNARLAAIAIAFVAGCSHKPSGDGAPADAGHATTPTSSLGPTPPIAIDAIAGFDACALGYRGAVLDLGAPSSRARFGSKLESPPVETIEREGATWARVRARTLTLDFFAGADERDASFIDLRIRGVAAKSVTLYVNGKLAGTATLAKGEARVVTIRATTAPLVQGSNELLLRFGGAPKATTEPLVELDWVHVGSGEPDVHYAAPTRADAIVSASFAGEPRRAVSLRAPGYARCAGWIPAGATVETYIGLAGDGDGDAEVRLVRDRTPPVVLGAVHVTRAEAATRYAWPVGDLGDKAGTLGAIELASVRASKGARLVFGEPRVVAGAAAGVPAASAAPAAPARGLVLVVLGGIATRSLALYGGPRPVPEMMALAKAGATFESNRATTGLASGAFASMLAGLRSVDDADARLPHGILTIADAARQAGIVAAMFTANPTTGAAFGFDRGWSTFEAHAPNDDTPATLVFDDAARWVEEHKAERFLVVVHARGGHPPWDVSPDALKALDPPGYNGGLDPKHAAELLSKARRQPGSIRYTDADRARASALYAVAVDAHDAALGRLVAAVRAAGREANTAFIVLGDTAVNEAAHVAMADADALDEATLWTPLVVSPASALAGARVATPTSSLDVARTAMNLLGLAPPATFGGVDLFESARGESPAGRPLIATAAGRFAARWGNFVLSGQKDRETKLCDLALEPACVSDVRPTYPLAVDILHRVAFDALVTKNVPAPREPATIDAITAAALRTWGR